MTDTHHPIRGFRVLAAFLALALAAVAQNAAPKNFNVPAGDAAAALKTFSQQAGVEVLFPTDAAQGVRTNAVSGSLTPRAALERLVAGTGFEVVQDEKTGALGLRETAEAKNAASRTATRVVESASGEKAIQLEEVRVLGSRIRQTETEGPSPVMTYDREYMRATGALTLADFLNNLPQNYTGIGAGRGSTPNELNPEFGQRTETTTPPISLLTGAAGGAPGQSGVSGVSLRGLGSGSTLVLIDGRRANKSGAGNRSTDSRQGFVDVNTIPFGMVERVEVITDGASAIYGADAVAGVINIVLKKNYVGTDLTGSFKGAQHGGGRERALTLSSGFSVGKLITTLAIDYYDRANLRGDERSFSRQQNHTGIQIGLNAAGQPVFGRDLRILNYGYPATVVARTGNLTGITQPGGAATNTALVPDGTTTTPTVAQFIGVPPATFSPLGSRARSGNTGEYLDLIPPSERYGIGATASYKLNDRVELFGSYTYSHNRASLSSQPTIVSASTTSGFGAVATIVPAAFNPFGQDVVVGYVIADFGGITQYTDTTDHKAVLSGSAKFGQTWATELSVTWQKNQHDETQRNFNNALMTAALANPDANQRINPFIDARAAGYPQKLLYDAMAIYGYRFSGAKSLDVDFIADGELFNFWGGPIKAAVGASWSKSKNDSIGITTSTAVTPVVTTTTINGEETDYAIFGETIFPIVGKENSMPENFIRRLDFTTAFRYEDHERAGSTTVPKYGFSWVPFRSLLVRGSFSEGFRAPDLTEYQVVASPFTTSITDPRRTPATTTGVTVTRGSNPNIRPETSKNYFYGLIYEPAFAKGLNVQVNYYRTIQSDAIRTLSASVIVQNEAVFPGRVVRAAPTPADIALNQPGQILSVDTTILNNGETRNESVDFLVRYDLPWRQFGNFRIEAGAAHTLKALATTPNAIILRDDEGDTFAPPKWKMNASVIWNKGNWNGSLFYNYLSAFKTNAAGNFNANNTAIVTDRVPAQWVANARVGYEFKNGFGRRQIAKNLIVSLGSSNIFDEEPPFYDTIFGFNGALHSPLGRTYEIQFTLPIK